MTVHPTPVPGSKSGTFAPAAMPLLLRQGNPFDLATPCYVYDPAQVIAAVQGLRARLGTGLVVSLKANPDPDLYTSCCHAFSDGVEVASLRELDVTAGSRIVRFVNNPAMGTDLVRAAVAMRSTVIVDHAAQADLLIALRRPAEIQPVLLRINASDAGLEMPRSDHFGMSIGEAGAVARRLLAEGIRVSGCHLYAGSHALRRTWRGVGRVALSVAAAVEAAIGAPLTTINLGGGFGIDDAASAMIEDYAASLGALRPRYELLHESGRAIFARAGMFVVRVVAVKTLRHRHFVICDGGLAQNLLLSGITAPIRRHAMPAVMAANPDALRPAALPVTFVGSSCNPDDVIGEAPAGAWLPHPGDLIVWDSCGAYSQTFSVVDFLGLPRARTYLRTVDGLEG
jgi:diaminopimelate decarboxylase